MSKHSRDKASDLVQPDHKPIHVPHRPHLPHLTRSRKDLHSADKGNSPVAFQRETPRDSVSPQQDENPASYKKSSLSKGTLSWQHRRTSSDSRANAVSTDLRTKIVAFTDPPEPVQRLSTMATLTNGDRTRSRRERTFIGGQCAACEELLEHTLQGERILQFSCGHVAHEACFYEYIKDSDAQFCPTCDAPLGLDSERGGSMLDLSKLTNMVRSFTQQSDAASVRTSTTTPMPWEKPVMNNETSIPYDGHTRADSQEANRDSQDSQRMRIERYGPAGQHSRNNSGNDAPGDLTDNQASSRQHAFDVHAMESTVSDEPIKQNITVVPSPIVLVRSEFPTVTRSNQQQSLTCLVTVEVPELRTRHYTENHRTPALATRQRTGDVLRGKPFSFPSEDDGPTSFSSTHHLNQLTTDLEAKVDNWHGLDFARFGALRLHGTHRIGKDQKLWQELECYLFDEMLICVKEKKNGGAPIVTIDGRELRRCTLKGSILIRRHLQDVQARHDRLMLTLNLSVQELPTFHLKFLNQNEMEAWKHALLNLNKQEHLSDGALKLVQEGDASGDSGVDDDYDQYGRSGPRSASNPSSVGYAKSVTTAYTEHSVHQSAKDRLVLSSLHTPLDVVVVVPVSSSMQGLKISLLKDTLRFVVNSLGERDRMGLVTFGSSQGGVPLVGMTSKRWKGWDNILSSIKPVGQKSLRADVVDGANVAMDLLMQRKGANPISSILLISDSSTSESEGVNFVVSRAEAAKVGIYSFGLGLTHKPDSMIEISSRTKASYMYVKDWMMLRECVAGCLGSLQSISHQNVKLRLKLPEGSPAAFFKISGAMSSTRRATGRDAEAALGDLRFGDKRDILVQLVIEPHHAAKDQVPQDHWETIVSGLEALGGPVDNEDARMQSVEEVPLLQADTSFTDFQVEDAITRLSPPSLLTITMLPTRRKSRQNGRPMTPPIPSHPSIVQRRMELLTSDMLTRALTLASKQQHDRAQHLLVETRSILKGLSKGSLPPLPPSVSQSATLGIAKRLTPPKLSASPRALSPGAPSELPDRYSRTGSDPGTPTSRILPAPMPGSGIDPAMMNALDADIMAALEWINHPAVFGRDSRKAVLQAIGVIATQRGYTFRNAVEGIWAERIVGIKRSVEAARAWRDDSDEVVVEEQ